jgi:hypothetical protein
MKVGAFDRRWAFCGEPKFSFNRRRGSISCFKFFRLLKKLTADRVRHAASHEMRRSTIRTHWARPGWSYRGSISSGARARKSESINVLLKDGFTHDGSLHCFPKPIAPSLPSGRKPRTLPAVEFHTKLGDCLYHLFWLVEDLADERSFHITEKPEVQSCKIRTARWVRYTSNMVLSDKLLSDL